MPDQDTDLDDLETTETTTATKPAVETTDIETDPAPDSPPPLATDDGLSHEFHEHDGRRWPTIALYLAVALAAAFLIVLAARGIYHAFHHHKDNKPTPGNHQGYPPSSPGSHRKPSNHKTPNGNGSSATGAVPNTGPGDTVGLFVGITLAAAGLHYIINLRKTAKE